jgi:hypothetical protein
MEHIHYLRVFLPLFRSVPWRFARKWEYVDILYSALVADGSTLPVILFTTDPHVPEDVEGDSDAVVIYMPDIKKPCAATTLAALDQWTGYLVPGDHLLLDKGTEFKNKKVAEDLELRKLGSSFYPTGGGAFANPNDNSFFSQMEGYYKRAPKKTHVEAIKAIIAAYYRVKDEHVSNHFRNCLLTGRTPQHHDVKRLIDKSCRAVGARFYEYNDYLNEYYYFKCNTRQLSPDVRRQEGPLQLDDPALDGAEWNTYH